MYVYVDVPVEKMQKYYMHISKYIVIYSYTCKICCKRLRNMLIYDHATYSTSSITVTSNDVL